MSPACAALPLPAWMRGLVVDYMQGKNTIKLKKDKSGQHHYIPSSWVTSVDDKVHLDRAGDQAMREWSTAAPTS